MKIKIDISQIH
jgi:DNA-directed RNA polymerase subunit P